MAFAVLPALVLGKLFDDKIDEILGNPYSDCYCFGFRWSSTLVYYKGFKNHTIHDEKEISIKKAVIIGFGNVLQWCQEQ